MAENRNSRLDRRQLEKSLALLSDGATELVLNVLNEVALDSRQWEAAVADPPQFLRDRGIDLPDGVEVLLGTGTRERPFPPPEIELELVVIRTFWWCTRSPGEPQTCLRVNLEVPKVLIN
ncbi:hypothetical protein AB0M20_30125 [Actinoplanes sp. NPDC051633]|uniref:hypothetical protein n=1 Tax=Actinoplanes sp. NPDC051633 TaxID=3155670 RepID=UPI0034185E56